MNRFFLRLLNAPALILIAALGLAIQSSLFAPWPVKLLQPDVVLIIVLWCSLKRDFVEGGVLTLILADIAELHSAAPSGTFMISYMAVYLMVRLTARVLVIEGLRSYVLLTLGSMVAWKMLNYVTLSFLGASRPPLQHILTTLVPGMAVEAGLAAWGLRILDRFDSITFRKPGTEHGLEDELQVQHGEGI